MNIVINTASSASHGVYYTKSFIKENLSSIIKEHPEHSFFLIGNENLAGLNVTIIAPPKATNKLSLKIWHALKLPALLKKHKANVLVNLDNTFLQKTIVPQLLLVPDISFAEKLTKKNAVAYFNTATIIITFSLFIKNKIVENYGIDESKIAVVYAGVSELFLPVEESEKGIVKEKYTEGKEYFLFSGEIHTDNNLINLLKAFSFFKKRQKSNMQLVIATASSILPNNTFIESLKTYKYRNDVKLIPAINQRELINLTAAAYAFVYTPTHNDFYISALQALRCEVPTIVSNTVVMNEIFDDAALFTDPAVFENIADKMMLVYKDENKRKELMAKGKTVAAKYPLATTNQLLWQNIVKCAGAAD